MSNVSKKKKPTGVRRVTLSNPFVTKWPLVDPIKENELIDQFLSVQNKISESGKAKRFGLVCGLNAVSRSVEKNTLGAVLLSTDAKPPHLAEHLIPLCAMKDVPVISLRSLEASIAKNMKITTLLALGITKEAEMLDYNCVISTIKSLAKSHNDTSNCKVVSPLEQLPQIQPPPAIFIKPKPLSVLVKQKPSVDESTVSNFFSLKHGTFPGPSYPEELNTLSINVFDPSRTLKDLELDEPEFVRGVKRKDMNQYKQNVDKKPILVATQLKQTFSKKSGKKKKLKNNKK